MRLRLMRPIILVIASAALLAAAGWSILVGWADFWAQQLTLAGTEKALAATPWQSVYHIQLALLVSDDDPKRASEALQRAISLNPSDSRAWIELGLGIEAGGDAKAAEQYFLHAAEVDKGYTPRWSLANYYLRRDDETRFWFWSKAAAQMLWGDPLPLFRLCGRVVEDGNLIDRLDIRNPDTQAAYLSYLLSQDRLDLIGPATHRLLERGRESDVRLLLTACDRLISAGLTDDALALWNRLAETGKIPYAPLNRAADPILNHDSFLPGSVSQAFVWRLLPTGGVSASRAENPPGLRLAFSGDEPEECAPLVRDLPVEENTAYEFTVLYRTAGIEPNTGLAWHVRSLAGVDLGTPAALASEDGSSVRIRFVTPSGCRLARMALEYRRALGTTRIEGSILLREAGLRRAP